MQQKGRYRLGGDALGRSFGKGRLNVGYDDLTRDFVGHGDGVGNKLPAGQAKGRAQLMRAGNLGGGIHTQGGLQAG